MVSFILFPHYSTESIIVIKKKEKVTKFLFFLHL